MLKFFSGHFLSSDFQAPKVNLQGKVAVITAGAAGVGYEASKQLMQAGVSKLILAVRDLSKGEKGAQKLQGEVPGYQGSIELWKLDMASFASVREFGERLQSLARLDIFVANAGVYKVDWNTTPDGWEEGLQVNVISTGLLALLALPKLASTANSSQDKSKPHLAIVASEVHEFAKFPQKDAPNLLAALNDEKQAVKSDLYNTSKLLTIFVTRELAQLPAAHNVVVNCLTPGLCYSDLRRDLPSMGEKILNRISWPAEKGARNYIYAATQDTGPGAYIAFCQVVQESKFVRSERGAKVQKKLFNELKDVWVREAPEAAPVLA